MHHVIISSFSLVTQQHVMLSARQLFLLTFSSIIALSNEALSPEQCSTIFSEDDIFSPRVRNGADAEEGEAPWNVAIVAAVAVEKSVAIVGDGAKKKSAAIVGDGAKKKSAAIVGDEAEKKSVAIVGDGAEKKSVVCGGALVGSRHVVTAAHCVWINFDGGDKWSVKKCNTSSRSLAHLSRTRAECRRSGCKEACYRLEAKQIQVLMGSNNISCSQIRKIQVANVIFHPNWKNENTWKDAAGNGDDIAMLELAEDVQFSGGIRPICLPFGDNQLSREGNTVKLVGFGVKGDGTDNTSKILQSAELIIFSKLACNDIFLANGYRLKDQICALGDDGKDACKGDSGGALTAVDDEGRSILIGLVSFGLTNCGTRPIPGVYTNVTSHVEWITNVMNAALEPLPPPVQSCTCIDFSPNGKGKCRTKSNGRRFCYIQPGGDCPDARDSSLYPGQRWSLDACPARVDMCNPKHQFQCDNDMCVHSNWICDGEEDCRDGSDEDC